MTLDIIGMITAAMALIGFVTVWINVGGKLGKHENALETVIQRVGGAEADIAALKAETKTIQVDVARSMAKIEVKLDYIQDTLAILKGGRRAEEKQGRAARSG